MEVEDSGGVVLTAYHSYARPQPPSSEPRCAPRAAASHPGSRYRAAPKGQRFPGLGGSYAAGFSARALDQHYLIVVSSFGGLTVEEQEPDCAIWAIRNYIPFQSRLEKFH
ncbi:hypothetical protein CB1_000932018 [Camelus ferus]|nr:hypothetical protein CB1_000932018 [Camelus ferus]